MSDIKSMPDLAGETGVGRATALSLPDIPVSYCTTVANTFKDNCRMALLNKSEMRQV
jgi:AMMECR1 domain-containing protein